MQTGMWTDRQAGMSFICRSWFGLPLDGQADMLFICKSHFGPPFSLRVLCACARQWRPRALAMPSCMGMDLPHQKPFRHAIVYEYRFASPKTFSPCHRVLSLDLPHRTPVAGVDGQQ
jgi:hypothetical protein